MLENDDNQTDEVKNFISKIKPALWKENEMTGKEDRSNILLRSEVVTDSGNEILRKILETGVADAKAKDNYSRNYNKFLELYREKGDFVLSLVFPLIFNSEMRYALQENPVLMQAIYCYKGILTHQETGERLQIPWRDLLMLCWGIN